jgi:hypothetical protein
MKSVEQPNPSCEAGNLYRLLPSVNDLLLMPGFTALLRNERKAILGIQMIKVGFNLSRLHEVNSRKKNTKHIK